MVNPLMLRHNSRNERFVERMRAICFQNGSNRIEMVCKCFSALDFSIVALMRIAYRVHCHIKHKRKILLIFDQYWNFSAAEFSFLADANFSNYEARSHIQWYIRKVLVNLQILWFDAVPFFHMRRQHVSVAHVLIFFTYATTNAGRLFFTLYSTIWSSGSWPMLLRLQKHIS